MLDNILEVMKTVNESYKAYTVGVVFRNSTFSWYENTNKVELVGNTLTIHSEGVYEFPIQEIMGLTLVD